MDAAAVLLSTIGVTGQNLSLMACNPIWWLGLASWCAAFGRCEGTALRGAQEEKIEVCENNRNGICMHHSSQVD